MLRSDSEESEKNDRTVISRDRRWLRGYEATPPQDAAAPGGTHAAMTFKCWTLQEWCRCLLYSVSGIENLNLLQVFIWKKVTGFQ